MSTTNNHPTLDSPWVPATAPGKVGRLLDAARGQLDAGQLAPNVLEVGYNLVGGGAVGLNASFELLCAREQLIRGCSWAVPSDAALEAIAQRGPVVEIGAGSGYWARLLSDRGVDVVAYDAHAEGCRCNGDVWCRFFTEPWFPVQAARSEVAGRHPDRTLLLVWPPRDDDMAAAALRAHLAAGGRHVVYVGEDFDGQTASAEFLGAVGFSCGCEGCGSPGDHQGHVADRWAPWHDLQVAPSHRIVADVEIPSWTGSEDRLWIHERLEATESSPR